MDPRTEIPYAKLSDLFDHVDSIDHGQRPAAAGWKWTGQVAGLTLVVSALLFMLSRLLGLAPSPLLILAVAGGIVLVQSIASTVREPRWRRTADVLRPPSATANLPVRGDGMLTAVRRWDRRLAAAGEPRGGRPAADHGLRTGLGELADERLRQRFGVTRASDPTRARQVLGEPVWALLHATQRPPTAAEVEVAIRRLESL